MLDGNPHANWLKREVESSTRFTLHVFASRLSRRRTATQVPNFAHIWAHCLALGRGSIFDTSAALRICFVIGSYSRFGIGIALALS